MLLFRGLCGSSRKYWWKLFLWQLVMMFKGFGTTFVYVVVRRFVFDFGVSLFLVVSWCFL